MEGSESGARVPSDTIMEVETWVKLSNFPAMFLTAEAISVIVSSFGSPVMTDEDTYEKLENHKWHPKLRRKLHSSITFVRALVRVSVTEPLPPSVAVFCPQGRKFIIRIDYDPTPKICRNCLCAGHFDFECCGIVKESVESMVDDAVAVEDVLGVDFQLADCCDSMNDEVDGEQGAVTIDGVESFEDSSVVEAVISPAATCDFDDAHVSELEADFTMLPATCSAHGVQGIVFSEGSVGFEDSTVVEAALMVDSHILPAASCDIGAAAVPEMQPLLPATYTPHGVQGTVISEGSESFEDPPVLEVDFGAAVADLQAEVGDLEAVQTSSDCFDDEPSVGKQIDADLLATVGESIAADLQELAAVPIPDGFDEEPTVERIAAVSYRVVEQVVGFNVLFPFEPGPFFLLHYIMDLDFNDYLTAAGNLLGLLFFALMNSSIELSSFEDFSVVKSSRQHHKWREKTVEQRFREGDSGSEERLLGVDIQDADCIGGIIAYIGGVQGAVIIDRVVCCENPPDFEAALEEDFHIFDQVFFVVNSSNKHHKWRDKSDVQGLFCCHNVLGLSGFDEQPSVEFKETSAVLPFSDFGAAIFCVSPAALLQGRVVPCIDEDSFEELDVLQSLGRFMAATNSTHEQLIFKIQHKWRDKSMG